jgi:hypothetical protein
LEQLYEQNESEVASREWESIRHPKVLLAADDSLPIAYLLLLT